MVSWMVFIFKRLTSCRRKGMTVVVSSRLFIRSVVAMLVLCLRLVRMVVSVVFFITFIFFVQCVGRRVFFGGVESLVWSIICAAFSVFR